MSYYSSFAIEDDSGEVCGRIRTDSEMTAIIATRPDLFCYENGRLLKVLEGVCVPTAVMLSIAISSQSIDHEVRQWADKESFISRPVVLLGKLPQREQPAVTPPPTVSRNAVTPRRTLARHAGHNGSAGRSAGGGGSYRERVARFGGVLALATGRVSGPTIAFAEIDGHGGYTRGIDLILQGQGGLARGGNGESGRHGAGAIGFGSGPGSGFGGGSGMGDIAGLMDSPAERLDLTPRRSTIGTLTIPEHEARIRGGATIGGRSKSAIMAVVQQNIAALRYNYNRFLRDNPQLHGKITVRFAIDEFGKVMFCEVASSTIDNQEFQETILSKIRRWAFGKIDVPGDVTEVTYPFVFAQ